MQELYEFKDLFEKTLEFLKSRMRENIINNSSDSILDADAEIKTGIEKFIEVTIVLIKDKQKRINDKLKKYNL